MCTVTCSFARLHLFPVLIVLRRPLCVIYIYDFIFLKIYCYCYKYVLWTAGRCRFVAKTRRVMCTTMFRAIIPASAVTTRADASSDRISARSTVSAAPTVSITFTFSSLRMASISAYFKPHPAWRPQFGSNLLPQTKLQKTQWGNSLQ